MFKSELQQLSQRYLACLPSYSNVRDRAGPDHIPSFRATVTVDKETFESPNPCRNVKEAQNTAAEVAVKALKIQLGFAPSCSEKMKIKAEEEDIINIPPQKKDDCGLGTSKAKDESSFLEAPPVAYKNRLQEFVVKHRLSFPTYSTVKEGLAHAPQFKASVTVGDKTFQSQEYFPTLRQAEQAAAALALKSLAHEEYRDGNFEELSAPYKNFLLEKAQKERISLPTYSITRSGPEHVPIFVSTVSFMGRIFEGLPANSRKQAEKNAAMTAWKAITNGSSESQSTNVYTSLGVSRQQSCLQGPSLSATCLDPKNIHPSLGGIINQDSQQTSLTERHSMEQPHTEVAHSSVQKHGDQNILSVDSGDIHKNQQADANQHSLITASSRTNPPNSRTIKVFYSSNN